MFPRIVEKNAIANSSVPRFPVRNERIRISAGSTSGRGWVPAAPRDDREQRGGRAEAGEHPRAAPAPVAALDDRQREQPETDRRQRAAAQVGQAGHRLVAALLERAQRRPHEHRAEREVDQEDPAPVGQLDEDPAQRRAARRRQRRRGAPDAHARRALLRLEGDEQERERYGREERGRDALEDARGDQGADARRHRAGQAGRDERDEPRDEDLLAPEPVGDAARGHQQRGDHDEVAVEHPGQRGRRRPGERVPDRREARVDDRRVEEREERAAADGEEREGSAGHAAAGYGSP
jgi:hypothetical protein